MSHFKFYYDPRTAELQFFDIKTYNLREKTSIKFSEIGLLTNLKWFEKLLNWLIGSERV